MLKFVYITEKGEKNVMRLILSSYLITERTIIVEPYRDEKLGRYITRVIEVDKEFLVNQSPLFIINRSCRKHGVKMEQMKRHAQQLQPKQRKMTYVISTKKKIIMFPTCSVSNIKDCYYIATKHISRLIPHQGGTKIKFKNGYSIDVKSSIESINRMRHKSFALYGYCTSF
ncbi:MAG TPA: hypothetical protein DCY20_01140 [Firmicutes bacterium]|nr:hypothetical protein [Bacillota bacterium]